MRRLLEVLAGVTAMVAIVGVSLWVESRAADERRQVESWSQVVEQLDDLRRDASALHNSDQHVVARRIEQMGYVWKQSASSDLAEWTPTVRFESGAARLVFIPAGGQPVRPSSLAMPFPAAPR